MSRFRHHLAIRVLLLCLATAACGTRVPEAEQATHAPASGSVALDPAASTGGVPGFTGAAGGTAQAPAALPSAGDQPVRIAGPSGAATGGRGGQGPAATSVGGAGATAGRTTPAGAATTPATAPGAGSAPGAGLPPTGAGPVGEKSPVVIASAGTFSGPIGAILLPGTQTVSAWVAHINANGGLGGHQVKLLVYDDGGDPARRQTQIKEAIERRGVIAFVHNAAPFESKTTQDYITAQRIPVIGTETGTEAVYRSPMYFPQATSGSGNIADAMLSAAMQLAPAGKIRVATLTCVEAQQCTEADALWAELGPQVGMKVVSRGRASITQPDYTAECLSARNAQADVVVFALDPNAASRLALSCARQGYRPTYATLTSLALDRHKTDPNLDGMVQGSNVFPYFQTGTPATDEFQ
ncbi:MAG TPA: ABC transporter substrate-binding protein, partial [Rugosimonospora sp.]|nr:ABC transporter substrate-binding protein [Rugosimonospora sp.]